MQISKLPTPKDGKQRKMLIALIQHSVVSKSFVSVMQVNHEELARIRHEYRDHEVTDADGEWSDSISYQVKLLNTKRLRKQYLPRNAMYQRSLNKGELIEMRHSGAAYRGSSKLPYVCAGGTK